MTEKYSDYEMRKLKEWQKEKFGKKPVLHWFNTGGTRTTCGLHLYGNNIQTPTIRDHTTCKRCIASLKKVKLW